MEASKANIAETVAKDWVILPDRLKVITGQAADAESSQQSSESSSGNSGVNDSTGGESGQSDNSGSSRSSSRGGTPTSSQQLSETNSGNSGYSISIGGESEQGNDRGGNRRSSGGGSHTARSGTQHERRGRSDQSSGGAQAEGSAQKEHSNVCIGLNSTRLDKAATIHSAYCHECFEFCKGAFRDKKCLLTKDSGEGDNCGWIELAKGWQCKKCENGKKNIKQDTYPLLWDRDGGASKSPLPGTIEMMARVCSIFKACNSDDNFNGIPEVASLMGLLRQKGIIEVDLNDGRKLVSCPGYWYQPIEDLEDKSRELLYECNDYRVVKARVDNTDLCSACSAMQVQHARNIFLLVWFRRHLLILKINVNE